MLLFPVAKYRKRPPRPRGSSAPPAPPTINQILDVVRGPGVDELTVTVNAAVVAVAAGGGLWIEIGAVWHQMIAVDLSDPFSPVFQFAVEVAAAGQWLVDEPALWTMANGAPLAEPYGGAFIGP